MALESTEMSVVYLGLAGLHGKTIARTVRGYWGVRLSVSQVYSICRKHGVRLRDYRDGKGDTAKAVIKSGAPKRKASGRRKTA